MSSQHELPVPRQARHIQDDTGVESVLDRTEFETIWGLNFAPIIDHLTSELIWMTEVIGRYWKDDVWIMAEVAKDPSGTLTCVLGHKDYGEAPLLVLGVTPARLGRMPLIRESLRSGRVMGLRPEDMVTTKVRLISQCVAWAWLELEANREAIRVEGARTGLRVAREQMEKQRKQAMASGAPQDTAGTWPHFEPPPADDMASRMGRAAGKAARKSKGCFGVLFLGFVMIAGVTVRMTLY